MPSRRVLKAAEAIREVVSLAILADLKDPRITGVTVTFVEVAGDMRQAKVHVSLMGTESQRQLCLHGLQNSAGFLQKKISNRIDTRYTPRLEFVLDEGVKKSIEIARILKEVLPEEEALPAEEVADAAEEVTDEESSVESGESPGASSSSPAGEKNTEAREEHPR